MKKKSLKVIGISVSLAVFFTVATLAYIAYEIYSPQSDIPRTVIIDIYPGATFKSALRQLRDSKMVRNPKFLWYYAKFSGLEKKVRVGEYEISSNMNIPQIMEAFIGGKQIIYKVTIPEGFNIYQIAKILDDKGLVDKKEFIDYVFQKTVRKKYKVSGPSLEGYLYPDSYRFNRFDGVEFIVNRMISNFRKNVPDDILEQGWKFGLSKQEVIVFASIVEKETGESSERALIASVFHQ